jgi:hypothetical protein
MNMMSEVISLREKVAQAELVTPNLDKGVSDKRLKKFRLNVLTRSLAGFHRARLAQSWMDGLLSGERNQALKPR